MRSRMFLAIVVLAGAYLVTVKADQPSNIADKGAKIREKLILEEQIMARQFAEFEQSLLRLKQRLEKSSKQEERDRAVILGKALDKIKDGLITTRFEQLVDFLKNQKLNSSSSINEAVEKSNKLAEELRYILYLLREDTRANRVREEMGIYEKLIKDLDREIRIQRIVQAQTDRGKTDKYELVKNQEKSTQGTAKILDKVNQGGKNGQGDPKNLKGNPKDAGKGEGKKGEGKDGGKEAAKGESRDAGKNSKGQQGGAKGSKAGSESKPGQSKGSKGGEGKAGSKGSKSGEGKQGSSKSGDPGEKKAGQGKDGGKESSLKEKNKGEAKTGQDKKQDENKQGEAKSGSKSGGQQAGSKNGSKSGSKASGSKSSGKSSKGQAKSGSQSSGQSQSKSGQQSPDQQANKDSKNGNQQPQNPKLSSTKKRIQAANDFQKKAEENIAKGKTPDASTDQGNAVDQMEKAKKELEELLRQLREEELEKMLASLQMRCEKMLAMQQIVLAGTEQTSTAIKSRKYQKAEEKDKKASLNLSDQEKEIVSEADKALEILKGEGSAVAFPEVFQQVRQDMVTVQGRLNRVDVAEVTQAIERDIIETLKEMIKALEKARQDMKNNKGKSGKSGGQPQDQKLLEKLAELKMIRSMQQRVYVRTKVYGAQYSGEQASEANVVRELHDLSNRQERIFEVTRKIAKGDNQ